MSDWMNEAYGESLATMQKMKSLGGDDEAIIAKAMMDLKLNEVPSYFLPERGAFLPNLGAHRAFTFLTEGKEALFRMVWSRCTLSRKEKEDLIGEEAMPHLDDVELHQGEINVVLRRQRLRAKEVSELRSEAYSRNSQEDWDKYDRAAGDASKKFHAENQETSLSLVLRDAAWEKMVEVMK